MVITLDPELEAALKEAAGYRNVAPEKLAITALQACFQGPRAWLQPQDEWEKRLLGLAIDCGVSLPDWALSREEMYD